MGRGFPVFDGHAHLDELKDLEKDLKGARDQGATAIIGVGMGVESNQKILAMSREHPGFVFPAIGYHPWRVRKADLEQNLEFIEQNAHRCIAIGEVGLDFKVKIKKGIQEQAFKEVVKLAAQHTKPLILHCRGAHRDVFSIISDMGVKKAVFHWYAASLELLREIVDAGYFISATPALTHSPPHQQAIREAPLDAILLETDSPVNHHGRPSQPSDVFITLEQVAKLKALPVNEVACRTSQNAVSIFGPLAFTGKESI